MAAYAKKTALIGFGGKIYSLEFGLMMILSIIN